MFCNYHCRNLSKFLVNLSQILGKFKVLIAVVDGSRLQAFLNCSIVREHQCCHVLLFYILKLHQSCTSSNDLLAESSDPHLDRILSPASKNSSTSPLC